ncbi:phosphodiesterase [Blastococcus sp. TML/M2B]|uniref:phosphodiesterase n=1 Tax=unclassified Blastococcus TaxID=2619396 RepID=UPI00190C5C99|nr:MULTISPECIES: phosphodiesterase [unclassified Blastococcus]MBN1094168.1 phosphodiesterase [Blastococcus sp. TML/M2B]MBN1095714.1 phosphodiesterase [Blastococcus sp. TML/C7B]
MADLSRGAGRLVAVPLAAVARWRSGKPMHPRGAVFDAVLERQGGEPPWGVPFLDTPGRDDVVVRLSRGAGLPEPWPDLLGLAVRLGGEGGPPVDLLLSSTGSGRLTRVVPALRRDAAAAYCSIMAYRSPAGPLRLAALPTTRGVPSDPGPVAAAVRREPLAFVLAAARGREAWRPFARLALGEPVRPLDPELRFDAVRHPPPGLVPDGPLARFRAPAYAAAQAARQGP